ncbi:MAG: hypothetical protein COA63_009760 [Methylophaga sp.]|nr:hypothetical protein [Methylophaga sp.]
MTNTTEPTKRIIKIEQCSTLTGKETLTYHIGCDDNKVIYFRVVANSGNGFFNKDWLALSNIQQAFEDWPVDSTITSFTLWSLLKGKSSNTSAFILATLKHEGIVATLKGKRRNHEYIEPVEFLAEMGKLIADSVDLKPDASVKKKPASTAKRTKSQHRSTSYNPITSQ